MSATQTVLSLPQSTLQRHRTNYIFYFCFSFIACSNGWLLRSRFLPEDTTKSGSVTPTSCIFRRVLVLVFHSHTHPVRVASLHSFYDAVNNEEQVIFLFHLIIRSNKLHSVEEPRHGCILIRMALGTLFSDS